MTSNALFTSVAESIVIFGPIRQVGCASASSGVTDASGAGLAAAERSAAGGQDETLHVSTSVPPPGIARWPSARCRSGAGGRADRRRAASSAAATRWPPVTSVSLLASATRRPDRSAASTAAAPPCRSWRPRPARRRRRWQAPPARRRPSARAPGRSGALAGAPGHGRRARRRAARRRPRSPAGGEGAHAESIPQAPRSPRAPDGRSSRSSRGWRRPVTPRGPRRAARTRPAPARRTGTSRCGRGCRRAPARGSLTPCVPPRA